MEAIVEKARRFFEGLNHLGAARPILRELDQKVQFLLEEGEPFFLEVSGGVLSLREGRVEPDLKDSLQITRFQTDQETLERLFSRKIRYSDALIPSGPGMGRLRLIEKWMFKKQVVNWLGRLVRAGQEGDLWSETREPGGP